jgi:hypothetical protein
MIRSLFLLLFVIWVTALGTLASCGQAGADPLPNIYLGKWCHLTGDEKSTEQIYFRDDGKCPEDSMLTIEHTRYHGWEFGCRYTSIKHTGEKLPGVNEPEKGRLDSGCSHIRSL